MDRMEELMQGKVAVLRVNAHSPAGARVVQEYRIYGVPTILVFKDGKVVFRAAGVPNPQELQELLQRVSAEASEKTE